MVTIVINEKEPTTLYLYEDGDTVGYVYIPSYSILATTGSPSLR